MEEQNHNTRYLEEAYRSLHNKLTSVGKICNLPESEAEDLIQEGFIRLYGQNVETEQEAKGKLWVTIRNLWVDRFRKERKYINVSSYEKYDSFQTDNDNLDYDFICRQIKSLLSPLQNQIMTLLIGEELDYAEIAAKLKMKEGAVRTNVSRARKILKEKLKL